MAASTSCRTWTEAEIAALSAGDIAQLNYDEMLELVSLAQPVRVQADGPQVTESDVLVRLVYALRQRCRNKIGCQ
jgi:hypothetical protein